MDIIVLKGTYRQVLTVAETGELPVSEQLTVFLKEGELHYTSEGKSGTVGTGLRIGDLAVYQKPKEVSYYAVSDQSQLTIGSQAVSSLVPSNPEILLILDQTASGEWELQNLGAPVYLNNHLLQGSQTLSFGSEIAFDDSLIKVFPKEIWVWGSLTARGLLKTTVSSYHYYEDYPDYHRSPRLIYRSSEDKVTVNAPPQEPAKPRNELMRMLLPPLVMIGVVVLISIFQPRGIYIFLSVAMGITTAVFSVQNYFRNKRDYKQSLADRISAYHAYLSDKSIQLTQLANEQRSGQFYHYPDISMLSTLAQEFSHRIYEKTTEQFDFLTYRLGLGEVPTSYQLSYSQQERSGVKDPLEAEGFELYQSHKILKDMPVLANLMHGPVGYVGERSLVLEQLGLLVHQLAFFHSYHDLRLITIMPESEKEQWEWMRWLPHAALEGINVRGFVYNQRTRDQVLNSLMQVLKQRQLQRDSSGPNQELRFSPHYVVLITDESLVMDHVIMEYFAKDPTSLGCSLIFVQDIMRSLSENVQTVVRVKDQLTGELVMEEGALKEQNFSLEHFPKGYDKESLSRRLAPLNHLTTLKSAIPDNVSFLEMYRAERAEDLAILSRWQSHSPHQSMAVPLGLRGRDDDVMLDLHERAHGPHGLIAGTTGSGKSELIQSYILSLAVNFHPHDVAFLLIDYKGGGMANLFKDLPHVLGMITNLDGNQAMRALASIKAENKRRQRLFAQAGVNHIHAYQKKYKQGEVKEPLPHLIIISDEFAELKNEQPDFISELVSTARIGRSLGVNLILATQKPAGVVNDQIWSNSNFRIALKVADKADSQEMLHTPDAADIRQAGRAYLQVGNNEVYELFQSAWSGADYQPDKDDQGIVDETISLINPLGQYEALNKDLSGLDEAAEIREIPTELEVVVDHIQEVVQHEQIAPLAQPWLPPLGERIYLEKLLASGRFSAYDALIGAVDLPSQQTQKTALYNPVTQGNLILLSQPGMGKSTFLQTLTMSLAMRHTPEEVQFYLLDFGTNGLLPLRQLPHTADFMTSDDEEKLSKFIKRMNNLLAERKNFLQEQGVANSTMYRELGNSYPQIMVMIDNYEGHKDSSLADQLDALVHVLTRDGNSLGITVVMTASRLSTLKGSLQSNMRERLALKMAEDNDVRTIIGKYDYKLEDIPGRGLIRYPDPEVFQVALPASGMTSQEVLINLQNKITQIDNAWTGIRPAAIPLVPEVVHFSDFMAKSSVVNAFQHGELPLGLSMETVESVSIPLARLKQAAYIADNEEHLMMITSHLVAVLSSLPNSSVMLFDTEDQYDHLAEHVRTYVPTTDKAMQKRLAQLILELKQRETLDKETDYKEWFGIIPDLEHFVEQSQLSLTQLTTIFERGSKVKMHLFIGGHKNYLGISGDVTAKYVRQHASHILFGMRMLDQNFLPKQFNSKEPYLETDTVYLHDRRQEQLLKITRD